MSVSGRGTGDTGVSSVLRFHGVEANSVGGLGVSIDMAGTTCLGPTNATFAMDPAQGLARLGTGTVSDPIEDIVTSNNPLQLSSSGLLVDGTDAPQVAFNSFVESLTFVIQWTGMAQTSTDRVLFRAVSLIDGSFAELHVNAANLLIWNVNGTAVDLGAGADDGGTHRAAVEYDLGTNVSGSFDGGTPVSTAGALPPFDIGVFWLGSNAGADQCNCNIQAPVFILPLPAGLTDAELQDASNLTTQFICGPFPDSMILADFAAADFSAADFFAG